MTELAAVRDTLRAALAAGCGDLLACSENPDCPMPFDTGPQTSEGDRCGC
ncbi:hypothetical protein ACWDUL_22485 [Nocardia niigatensis]